MSVPSIRPLAPARPAGPIAPAPAAPALPPPPVAAPEVAPDVTLDVTVSDALLDLGATTPERAAARLRDWRAFDLVDGRRRQARAELAVARRALEERSARHAPTRDAARALLAALAAGAPLGPPSTRAATGARGEFWLDDAVDALRMLADGEADAAHSDLATLDAEDRARTPLFVALGALRARLGRGATGGPAGSSAPANALDATPGTPAGDPATAGIGRLAAGAGGRAVAALAAQRPEALDPAAIPLLDAHARGLFDADAAGAIEAVVDGWAAALADVPARAEREVRRWSTALAGLCPPVPDELFPALRAAVGERWPAVATALRAAALPGALETWCTELDAARGASLRHSPADDADDAHALATVDAALAGLVDAPDAEETALAGRVREARMRLRAPDEPPSPDGMALAGEASSDEIGHARTPARDDPRASHAAAAPTTPELSPAPFGQWLATIAMAPARVGASAALRRWAVLRARAPLLGAFDLLADEARANPARDVAVALEGWRGRLGDPDAALVQSLDVAMRRRGAASELAVRDPGGPGLLLSAGLLMIAAGALARLWALALGGCAALAAWRVARGAHERRRARARAAAGMAHARAVATLRDVVDEWAAVRRDLADGVARMPSARDRLRRALTR